MCPVCTVTVIAGLGISRFLGIDDMVTSVWIGGFILSFSFIFYDWMVKKWPKLNTQTYLALTIFSMYALALIPLIKAPTILRILYGTFIGSVAFLLGAHLDRLQRKKYKKIFFPFQKVVFPVLSLIIASGLILWL